MRVSQKFSHASSVYKSVDAHEMKFNNTVNNFQLKLKNFNLDLDLSKHIK